MEKTLGTIDFLIAIQKNPFHVGFEKANNIVAIGNPNKLIGNSNSQAVLKQAASSFSYHPRDASRVGCLDGFFRLPKQYFRNR